MISSENKRIQKYSLKQERLDEYGKHLKSSYLRHSSKHQLILKRDTDC